MKAVVSVPLSFTSEQRQAVWKAAEKARFNILQVISEPAASLLAYGVGQSNKHETLYVILPIFPAGHNQTTIFCTGVAWCIVAVELRWMFP
jgi:hypothetical protein